MFTCSFTGIKEMDRSSNLPEIAFVGRSNVGKSSLINNLVNQKISYTSSTPGKTQLINFFLVNKQFYFVDLPGYGYAKVSKEMKKDWSRRIEQYIMERPQLKILLLLLDIRRIPNDQDKMISSWFKKIPDVQVVYILTKADKLSYNEIQKQKLAIGLELFVDPKDFILYSVPDKKGKLELLTRLEELLSEI